MLLVLYFDGFRMRADNGGKPQIVLHAFDVYQDELNCVGDNVNLPTHLGTAVSAIGSHAVNFLRAQY